jgi:hypothetical protein
MTTEERCECAISKGYSYDSETGHVTNRSGKILSTSNSNGYLRMTIESDGKKYQILQHRFGWYFVHGYIPECLDHINRESTDNRLINLREVTPSQNSFNCKNTKGYSFSKSKNRYRASIMVNGKIKTIGYYQREEDAAEAYSRAKTRYHRI